MIVWATHPKTPNKTMNARGRVLHVARPQEDKKFSYPATYCGMLVVERATGWAAGNRGVCFQCQKIQLQDQETAANPRPGRDEMPVTTYYSPAELVSLASKDKDINDVLNQVNKSNRKTLYITERNIKVGRFFKKTQKSYEVLNPIGHTLLGDEYQVINFYRDNEDGWSINLAVTKELVMAYLYGCLREVEPPLK